MGTPLASDGLNTMQVRQRHAAVEQPAPILLGQAQFAALYESHVERIYGFVFNHVGNREDAEDVTSQVFIKAYKNVGQFDGRGAIEGWLFQIARRAVADFWRDRYKLRAVPLADSWDAGQPDGEEVFDDSATKRRVGELLSRLPENYREVLVQRFLLRNSIIETARAMGVSEANARVLQFRALRRAAELARSWSW